MDKKYKVTVKIRNEYEVDADSVEEAEKEVQEMDLHQLLKHCDLEIDDVRLITKRKKYQHEDL